MRHVLIFLVTLLSVGFAVIKTAEIISPGRWRESYTSEDLSEPARHAELAENGGGVSPTACMSADDISDAIRRLTSKDISEVDQARTKLLRNADESEQCRAAVITALMKAMDRPKIDFTHDRDIYHLWLYGARLLGSLKASEAIDLLVSHLDLIDETYFSTSMNHQPALVGLIEMGPIAVPKLDATLRHHPDSEIRFYAVYCIATIGGPSAVNSLKSASNSESDACVRRAIRTSLDSFDDGGHIKDRMKWFSGLSCNQ